VVEAIPHSAFRIPQLPLRVAVIGAGPAGTVAALNLLQRARQADRPVRVLLLDRKTFTEFGPAGCNLCAGVMSAALIHDLEHLGVIIPPHVIQQKILGYELVTRGGSIHLPRPPGSVIYTAYRGIGPPGLEYDEERSFDAFLLRSAIQAGAEYRNSLVQDIRRRGGARGFQLQCQDGETLDADVIIGAFGINSTLGRRLTSLGVGYRPPRAVFACQAEVPVDQVFITEHYQGQIKIINLGLRRIRFASLTPKQRHITVSIIGRTVTRRDLMTFLEHPAVLQHFPPGWRCPEWVCACQPKLPVTAAAHPIADGMVVIGDADISRYLKDGIGSAFFTAARAAQAVLEGAGSREALSRLYYRPSRRRFRVDNWVGRVLFACNDLISRCPVMVVAFLAVTRWEQEHLPPGRRPLNEFLWGMFTGDAPYLTALRAALRPGILARLVWETLTATLAWLRGDLETGRRRLETGK
jgi:flavin-dependent dehydrogenase